MTIQKNNKTKSAFIFSILMINIILAALFSPVAAQSPKETPSAIEDSQQEYPPLSKTRLMELAQTDYPALLNEMIHHYDKNIADYTGVFFKQERIDKILRNPQIMNFKFRSKPFSVFFEWTLNPGGADRLLYVKGQNDDKMIIHPAHKALRWIKSVKKNPRDKDVFKSSLRSCDQFGIRNMMSRIQKIVAAAQQADAFKSKLLGEVEIDKRKCIIFELLVPKNELSKTKRLIFAVDIEHRLPVSTSSYDSAGDLLSTYTYQSLKFNTGLKDTDFTKRVNKL